MKVGIVGLGFMGRVHFANYQGNDKVTLAAVCDIDEIKLKGETGVAGNIEGAEETLDMSGIGLYTNFDEMIAKEDLDAVSIALPTYLHSEYTVKALDAGLNVLCEKPMAMNLEDCEKMIAAAEKSGKVLQIGHCIRFWPEYAKAKQLIDSGEYGKVLSASFRRLSCTPTWSWDNWLMDGSKSGGALVDLHIHDSDFIQYVFGMPKAVNCSGIKGPTSDYDHTVTNYIYDNDMVITAVGGWIMPPSFGFEMSFIIILEKANILYDCTKDPAFKVCPYDGDAFTPEIESEDGYAQEIEHFLSTLRGEKLPQITTPAQSLDSLKLVLAEGESATKGKDIKIK